MQTKKIGRYSLTREPRCAMGRRSHSQVCPRGHWPSTVSTLLHFGYHLVQVPARSWRAVAFSAGGDGGGKHVRGRIHCVAARCEGIGLREILKQLFLLLCRHADTAICDRELDP